jgi:hypothetical protein
MHAITFPWKSGETNQDETCVCAINPVVVSSNVSSCLFFSPLSLTSAAGFIAGVRYFCYAAISASRLVSYTGFSFLNWSVPRVFKLRPCVKVGPPKTLAQPHFKTGPATSKSLRLPGCSAPRSIKDPPSCALLVFSISLPRPRLRLRFIPPTSSLHSAVLSPAMLLRLGFVVFSGFSTNFGVS